MRNTKGTKKPLPPFSRHAAATACCAAGMYGFGCLKCVGCAAGSVGCAVGSAACYECIQQNQKQRQTEDPNYDPPGHSMVIDRSNNGENNDRVDKGFIMDYVKQNITYPITYEEIMSNFENVVPLTNYNESKSGFENSGDKHFVDKKIRQLNARHKKIVGGKKSKKYSKQKPTRKIKKTNNKKGKSNKNKNHKNHKNNKTKTNHK
jgi:hypothetical protein